MAEKREKQWLVSKLAPARRWLGDDQQHRWVPRWWFDSREEALRYVHKKPRAWMYRIDPITRGPRS